MPDTSYQASPMARHIAELKVAQKKLHSSPPETLEDVVREIRLNVYAFMIAQAENSAEIDEVVQEMVEPQESYVQPELAAQIQATITLGGVLAELATNLALPLDDLTKKKVSDAVDAFNHSVELTVMAVNDAVEYDDELDPADPPEDDDEPSDDAPGDEDPDEDGEPAEAEQPSDDEQDES